MGKNISECKECNPCDKDKPIKDCYTSKETCCTDVVPCNDKYDCDCVVRIGTDCVYYVGPDMDETHIKKGDILTDALLKTRSYMEDLKAYLENRLQMINRGKGLDVYRGENLLGFKEFRTLTSSGATVLKISNNNDEIDIYSPKPIVYKTKTTTKNKSLIKEVKIGNLLEETYLKGLKGTETLEIKEDKEDLILSVNEAYLNELVANQIAPSIVEITKEIERITKEIQDKMDTFDKMVDKKIEDAKKEIDEMIEGIKKEIEELGISSLAKRIDKLEEKTAFVKKGIVFIWNAPANTIPKGFRECKELAGRIPIGLLASNSKFNTLGKEGGRDEVVLTENELPAHTHTGTSSPAGGHSHEYEDSYRLEENGYRDKIGIQGGGSTPYNNPYDKSKKYMSNSNGKWYFSSLYWRKHKTYPEQNHVHTMDLDKTGRSQPFDITNPYRVVHYIEYVG